MVTRTKKKKKFMNKLNSKLAALTAKIDMLTLKIMEFSTDQMIKKEEQKEEKLIKPK